MIFFGIMLTIDRSPLEAHELSGSQQAVSQESKKII